MQVDFDGGTLEQYNQVLQLMGLTPMEPGLARAISRFATMTDTGLRLVDVLETQEQFEKFAHEQIGPFSQQAGFTGPSRMQFFAVHNYLTPGP